MNATLQAAYGLEVEPTAVPDDLRALLSGGEP